MKKEQMIDRVIGVKRCNKCGYPVSVEAYSVKDAQTRLEQHRSCCNGPCGSTEFLPSKINVIMKAKPQPTRR